MLTWLSSCFRNFLMLIFFVDFEMCCLNFHAKLFHAIVNWLWIEIKFAIFANRNKFYANNREFFNCLASSNVYLVICMLIKAIEIRSLKRLIMTLYHIVKDAFRNIFFSRSVNSIECQIKTNSRKHCDITVFSLLSLLIVVIFLSLFVNAYTSL